MKTCAVCKKGKLVKTSRKAQVKVGGHTFVRVVPATRCTACGTVLVAGSDVEQMETAAAMELARAGIVTPETFRFQRRVLGLPARELASLLGYTPEQLSRWENGKRRIDPLAAALLALLVREKVNGGSHLSDQIRVVRHPKRLAAKIRLPAAAMVARGR